MPTQVVLAKSLTAKGVMSIATKVAVQLCCKIGGAPWTVDIPLSVSERCSFLICFIYLCSMNIFVKYQVVVFCEGLGSEHSC